jgi:hypothetical protein
MICLAIVGILAAIILGAYQRHQQGEGILPSNLSVGINGITETRCIAGYTYVVGESGHPTQVIGDNGAGVRCQ